MTQKIFLLSSIIIFFYACNDLQQAGIQSSIFAGIRVRRNYPTIILPYSRLSTMAKYIHSL